MKNIFPSLFFVIQYHRAAKRMGNKASEMQQVFNNLLEKSSDKRCLQIGVKERAGKKFGDNWVSVDLYDTRDFIDFNYDIHDMPFPDASFETVVCQSVLEHVEDPQKAIAELMRVLKPGGKIWIQLPFHFPYHGQSDYWRVSPLGIRVWMKETEEICCGSFYNCGLATTTFYLGKKMVVSSLTV